MPHHFAFYANNSLQVLEKAMINKNELLFALNIKTFVNLPPGKSCTTSSFRTPPGRERSKGMKL